MHQPAYYLNEYKSEQVTTHENHGKHDWVATLVDFFGEYSIVLTSESQAQRIKCTKHSLAEAEREFDRFVAVNKRI